MSTGAMTGLVVGIIVGAVFMLGVGFFLGRREAEKKLQAKESEVSYPAFQYYKGNYYQHEMPVPEAAQPPELDGNGVIGQK